MVGANRQTKVIFVLAMNSFCKVLIARLRQAVLLIQDVQNAHQLRLDQVCRGKHGIRKANKPQREPQQQYPEEGRVALTYCDPAHPLLSGARRPQKGLMERRQSWGAPGYVW